MTLCCSSFSQHGASLMHCSQLACLCIPVLPVLAKPADMCSRGDCTTAIFQSSSPNAGAQAQVATIATEAFLRLSF